MPIQAYGLVTLFAVVSLSAGVAMARLVGPRRWAGAILPTAAAFGTLYLVGHRMGLVAGPQVTLFGFQVSIVLDVGVAIAAAFLAALAQRALLSARGRGPSDAGPQPAP